LPGVSLSEALITAGNPSSRVMSLTRTAAKNRARQLQLHGMAAMAK
jgi:hypothetical protein